MELTTVADDHAVVHDGTSMRYHRGLTPDSVHELDGFLFRTLPRPGELLARFATVNDVHFGEVECGIMEGLEMGPTFASEPGAEPYPELMNRSAIAEMGDAEPDVVVVKGDLTAEGTEEQYQRFCSFYGPAFGDRLVCTRGNHDVHGHATFAAEPTQRVELPGAILAVLDTTVAGRAGGTVSAEQLEWLHDLAADADRPVYVFGHHPVWNPDSSDRRGAGFGIGVERSTRLVEAVAAHPVIRGYFAGHTHRNRVRRFSATRDVPWVEVACVKDFPGAWAEYRVHEGGLLQIFRRISSPAALEWTERTRQMFGGLYVDYAFGELGDRCFAVPSHPPS
jgi:predicted phosphodiesterase